MRTTKIAATGFRQSMQQASRASKCTAHVTVRCASTDTFTRKWSTPLAKSLAEAITTTGPISIAKFMRQCLTSPEGGYYTRLNAAGNDQFGKAGDFITSPEISQIFGELVGIWFVAEWLAQGQRSSGVQLIELGPGRGTLMADILRTVSNFKSMATAIEAIYLVEASASLRRIQKNILCGEQASFEEHGNGQQCMSKHPQGVKIIWLEDISFLPQDPSSPFVVAHEFFDALPIHAFQSIKPAKPVSGDLKGIITTSVTGTTSTPRDSKSSSNRWHELVVSPTAPPSIIKPPKQPLPEFELTVSGFPAPHSQLLPNLSKRYKALLPNEGSTIEISPESLTTTQQLARMIGHTNTTPTRKAAGAALVIDYGPSSTIPVSSLRGIRSHRRTSPFENPGEVDISADVDFGALAEMALRASTEVEVHGPVEQGDWLVAMGGNERCEALVRKASNANFTPQTDRPEDGKGDATKGEEQESIGKRIETGWRRLVEKGPNGMGRLYKVMAIVPLSGGKRRPVGFGGDVAS